MKKFTYLIFMAVLMANCVLAQQPFCAAPMLTPAQQSELKARREMILKAQSFVANAKTKLKNPKTFSGPVNGVYTVPVVFHIAHTGEAVGTQYNPSDAQIEAYLALLNRGFNNTYNYNDRGINSIDVKIQFALAKKTPTNQPMTGIIRYDLSSNTEYATNGITSTGVTPTGIRTLTGVVDPSNYFNIYIIRNYGGLETGTTGEAGTNFMLLTSRTVNVNNFTSQTIIHEMGHSFDLSHIFQGSDGNSCPVNANPSVDGDGIADTDPIPENGTCYATGNNPCTNAPWNGMQYNHMGYSCAMDRFTQGQVDKMHASLNTEHAGFKNSSAMLPPGILPRVITAPTIDPQFNGNDIGMGPIYVNFNTIELPTANYSSDGKRVLADYTPVQATTVVAGATYPISLATIGNRQGVRVFIDFNNDGVFGTTAPEMVFFEKMAASGPFVPHYYNGIVSIPTTNVVLNTPLRMRVIGDGAGGAFDPVGVISIGQAEDYTVIVTSTLPVSLSEAKAYTQNNMLYVNWATVSEQNVERFDVQVSSDGTNFKTVGSVKSQAENGNSSTSLKYTFEYNMNGSNTLMISLLSLGSVLLFSIRNRKKYLMLGMFALVSTVAIISCKKTEKMDAEAGSTYVRIAQVDKDGKINYLPVITATKK